MAVTSWEIFLFENITFLQREKKGHISFLRLGKILPNRQST